MFHGLILKMKGSYQNVFFHIMGKYVLSAMCGTEDYIKKCHLQFCEMLPNFYLYTSVFIILSFFSNLYLRN